MERGELNIVDIARKMLIELECQSKLKRKLHFIYTFQGPGNRIGVLLNRAEQLEALEYLDGKGYIGMGLNSWADSDEEKYYVEIEPNILVRFDKDNEGQLLSNSLYETNLRYEGNNLVVAINGQEPMIVCHTRDDSKLDKLLRVVFSNKQGTLISSLDIAPDVRNLRRLLNGSKIGHLFPIFFDDTTKTNQIRLLEMPIQIDEATRQLILKNMKKK